MRIKHILYISTLIIKMYSNALFALFAIVSSATANMKDQTAFH
jgi:hypothetical protein